MRPGIKRALNWKWNIEVWFWPKGISSLNSAQTQFLTLTALLIKNCFSQELQLILKRKTTFKYLRNHYKYFTYGYGPDETNTMKFFDIANGNMFDNHEVLDLFTGINLFCWMSRKGNCLRLYFKNDEDLSNVKNG